MYIVKPQAKLIKKNSINEQIAYCAGVCYDAIKDRTEEEAKSFIDKLVNKGHVSILRHGTKYYRCKTDLVPDFIKYSPYCKVVISIIDGFSYISMNMQFYTEHKDEILDSILIPVEERDVKNAGCNDIIRYTVFLITSIAISRELNRVSPNNILEQSTRYVYENGTFCQPHWFNGYDDNINMYESAMYTSYNYGYIKPYTPNGRWEILDDVIITKNGYTINMIKEWLKSNIDSFNHYTNLINEGMPKQDARDLLPLDTATKCIYTYTLNEWIEIFNKRIDGKTGTPHPNAKLIMTKVKDLIFNH